MASTSTPAGMGRLTRRLILSSLHTGGLALATAACEASGDPTARGSESAIPVDLRLQGRQGGSGDPETELWAKTLTDFNGRQTKARATFEGWPAGSGPAVLAAAGTLGDVLSLQHSSGEYFEMAAKGHLAPLEPLAQRQRYDLKQFYPAALQSLKFEGKQFGLPHSAQPGYAVYFINLDTLGQAGIAEPNDATWTWQGVEDMGKRLGTHLGSDSGKWPMWPPTNYAHVVPAMRAFGGDLLSPDGKRSTVADPASLQGLEFVANLIHRHRIAPPPGALQGTAVQNLIRGDVAMAWWGNAIISTLKGQGQGLRWKAYLGPKGPQGRGFYMGLMSATQAATSKHPDQAFELLKHTVSKEAAIMRFEFGFAPAGRPDGWNDPRVTQDPAFKVFARAMEDATPLRVPANGLLGKHNDAVTASLDKIWSGSASVKDAAEAARRAAQVILDS